MGVYDNLNDEALHHCGLMSTEFPESSVLCLWYTTLLTQLHTFLLHFLGRILCQTEACTFLLVFACFCLTEYSVSLSIVHMYTTLNTVTYLLAALSC